jgi:hypothetical protein
VRRFVSPRSSASLTKACAEPDHDHAAARRPEDAEAPTGTTTSLIAAEDGDLWQSLPSRHDPSGTARPTLPVFANLMASLEEQEDARWRDLLEAMGFERQDQDAPAGFEDFDWSPIFPPDRELVARLLEPVVAKSGDVQEEINNIYARTI